MRRREPLSPKAVRELEAIDRALAGGPVDHDLRELEDLVRDVRASAPQMSHALTARLERELQQDSSPPAPAGAAGWTRPRLRVLVPALGAIAAALVALVVVIGARDGAEDMPSLADTGRATAQKGAPEVDREIAPGASRAVPDEPTSARSVDPPAPLQKSAPASSNLAPGRERKVQRSATLILQTPADTVESTADDVIRTVDRFRGIVASSSISADEQDGSEAVFDLRIPTSRLDVALAALSKLGHVAERRQDLQDITAAFTSARERLADARAERRGLLRALGNATTQAQIESLRARLRLVRSQIAAAKTQLGALERRASLSTVSVTVRGDGKAKAGGGGEWSPGDAAGDALRVLEVIAGVALIAIAVALPLALLGAAILLGGRVARARRRENALDAV